MTNVVKVKDMSVSLKITGKLYEVLHQLSFDIEEKETLAIVGESGCGKSMTALATMGLLPKNGLITKGEIKWQEEVDLVPLKRKERRKFRGDRMGMIFQEPMTALNPLLTIGYQLTENILQHSKLSRKEAHERAKEALHDVGISNPERRMRQLPFSLSGGLRQRVMIAMAMVVEPQLLICDEPTTALDVTIQKQVLYLLKKLKEEKGTSMLFITHDLGVVGEISDRVLVLYSGSKMEEAPVQTIFEKPMHPYTIGLFNAYPDIDREDQNLEAIEGTFPSLTESIEGCRFHPRCPYASALCKKELPSLVKVAEDHSVACHKVSAEMEGATWN